MTNLVSILWFYGASPYSQFHLTCYSDHDRLRLLSVASYRRGANIDCVLFPGFCFHISRELLHSFVSPRSVLAPTKIVYDIAAAS